MVSIIKEKVKKYTINKKMVLSPMMYLMMNIKKYKKKLKIKNGKKKIR
jgi:hypothetical protein